MFVTLSVSLKHLALLLLMLFVLSCNLGCDGGSDNSGGTPSSPTTAPPGGGSSSSAPAAKFVYALDATMPNNPSIAGFAFNDSSGALSQIPGSPFSIAPHFHVDTMTAISATSFVYTADFFDSVIQVFRADPNTGILRQTVTVNTPELRAPRSMLTDPSGKFLFVADPIGEQIGVYAIGGHGSLAPAPGSPVKIFAPVEQLTLNQAANLLYAAADNLIFGFTIAGNGSLKPVQGSPVTVRPPVVNPGNSPTGIGVAVDPAGGFLFVSDSTAQQTWVYSIGAGGSLSLVVGSPFVTAGSAGVLTVAPNGEFLFEGGENTVAAFQIQSGGILTAVPGSPFPNGPNLSGGAPVTVLVTDPQGKFLMTSNVENSSVTVFSIDPNSGTLANVPGSPFPVASKPIGGGSPATIAITH